MWQRITDNGEALILAAIGGLFLNMMNLYEDQKRPRSRRVKKDALYWVFFLFWLIAGAVIVYIYIATGAALRGLSAFLAGLTAPGFLQNLMQKTIPVPDSVKLIDVEEN
jgi:heme A synthase